MKINHEQSQQVPLDQAKIARDVHQARAAVKGARAGHLAGDNLNIGREAGGKPVQGGNQQGIPKPVLNAPSADPSAASYQAAMGHMDQLVADAQGDTLSIDLNELGDALEEASEEGGGGDAEGGVVIGKKGAKSRLKRTNVLAREVKLKNTSQEQAKDFSSQLKELGQKAGRNPDVAQQLNGSMGEIKDSMKSGEMDGKELGGKLSTMQEQAAKAEASSKKGETAGKNGLMQQLQSAGKPSHAQPAEGGTKEITVEQTENGFAGKVDGKDFSVDSKNKTMSLPVEGKTVQISQGAGGNISALADGAPFDLNQSEVKAYTDFFALMALFHEMGVEQRQMSRQGRNMANQAVVQKIKLQAKEQKSAAQAKMVAGMVSGSVKVASGGLNMMGSMKGMKADQAAANAGSSQMPGNMIAQQWSGFGQMVSGVGEASSSMLQFKAGLHEARSTELRAEEEQARFMKQTEQDQMQVAQELSSKARDIFSQVWNQYLQTQQNITRNI